MVSIVVLLTRVGLGKSFPALSTNVGLKMQRKASSSFNMYVFTERAVSLVITILLRADLKYRKKTYFGYTLSSKIV